MDMVRIIRHEGANNLPFSVELDGWPEHRELSHIVQLAVDRLNYYDADVVTRLHTWLYKNKDTPRTEMADYEFLVLRSIEETGEDIRSISRYADAIEWDHQEQKQPSVKLTALKECPPQDNPFEIKKTRWVPVGSH